MDILAHTLWANAGARAAHAIAEKKNKKFYMSAGWTAFFGVFPDLFAFTIPFTIRFYNSIFGSGGSFFGRPPVAEEGLQNGFQLAHTLYNYSHSLVIWA